MIEYIRPLYTDFYFYGILDKISNWTWRELDMGLEVGIITNQDIVEYAKFILEEDLVNFDIVLEIAISDKMDDISQLLQKLIHLEEKECEIDIMDKWRFAMLLQLYFNREKYTNVYEQIAEIGADFNYPEDMRGIIYYMPFDGIDLDTSWVRYLREQSRRFNIDFNDL